MRFRARDGDVGLRDLRGMRHVRLLLGDLGSGHWWFSMDIDSL